MLGFLRKTLNWRVLSEGDPGFSSDVLRPFHDYHWCKAVRHFHCPDPDSPNTLLRFGHSRRTFAVLSHAIDCCNLYRSRLFWEGIGMVLITVPVFLPVVVGYGFDPIWFGVLVVVLVELGLITPPVGMNLFIIKAQSSDLEWALFTARSRRFFSHLFCWLFCY